MAVDRREGGSTASGRGPILVVGAVLIGLVAALSWTLLKQKPGSGTRGTGKTASQKARKSPALARYGSGSGRAYRSRRTGSAKGLLPAGVSFGGAAPTSDAGPPDRPAVPESSRRDRPPDGAERRIWLRGRVVRVPSGNPVTSFTVVHGIVSSSLKYVGKLGKMSVPAMPRGALARVRKLSHPAGHFAFPVKPGVHVLQVKAAGVAASLPCLVRTVGEGGFRRTFGLLEPGRGAVFGTVVSSEKNNPLAGAAVALLGTGGSRYGWRMIAIAGVLPSETRFKKTGADGSFRFTRLPAGSYGLVIRAKRHTGHDKRGLTLTDGEEKDLGAIKLQAGAATVKGTIYGPDGQPKSGAIVVAISRIDGRRSSVVGKADGAGTYKLNGVPPGKTMVFAMLRGSPLANRQLKHLVLKPNEVKKLDFRFGSGGLALKGTVSGPGGKPLVKAKVTAMARILGPKPTISSGGATTDDTGEYRIEGLKEGKHVIQVTHGGRRSYGGSVEVTGAETQHDIRLRGGGLELALVDKSTGAALKTPAGVMLVWNDQGRKQHVLRADPGKPLIIGDLPDVPFVVRVFAAGYSAWSQENVRPSPPPGRNKIKVELQPAGKLILELKTPGGGAPGRAFVLVFTGTKYRWVPSQPTADGKLSIESLPPGEARLKIVSPGYKPLEVTVTIPTKGVGRAMFSLIPKTK